MAKATKNPQIVQITDEEEKKKALANTLSAIEKQYGKGAIIQPFGKTYRHCSFAFAGGRRRYGGNEYKIVLFGFFPVYQFKRQFGFIPSVKFEFVFMYAEFSRNLGYGTYPGLLSNFYIGFHRSCVCCIFILEKNNSHLQN